jgi:Uma2 family endonuclease
VDLQKVFVRIQDSIRLDPETQPQPDVVLARFREDFYKLRHPGPDEVFLVIEVADSSLAYDLGVKTRLYAAARVPDDWVVNLSDRSVEVFADAAGDHYEKHHVLRGNDLLYPTLLPALLLHVDEVFV